MYLAYSLFTGLIGLAFSVLLRLELSAPGNQYLGGQHHLYNVVVTTHGIIMIYFVVVLISPLSPGASHLRSFLLGLTAASCLVFILVGTPYLSGGLWWVSCLLVCVSTVRLCPQVVKASLAVARRLYAA